MSGKRIPQYEFNWDRPEPFTLVIEQTTDWEQLEREKRRKEIERKKQEKHQQEMILV